tara:strand:+ start:120 stop:680 length:561 start_codon:yes stop_codon:yes gene_type:complete
MQQAVLKKINQPLILMGYMGSGKTSIGKKISKILNINFFDLDELIEKKYNRTVMNIFNDFGEVEFRKKERAVLENIISEKKLFVLSLGGGTPCYFDNIQIIAKKTDLTIFLRPNIKQLSKKLFKKKSKRPLIKDIKTEKKMIEFVSKHMLERTNYYNMAKYHVTYDLNNKMDACNKIIGILNKNGL